MTDADKKAAEQVRNAQQRTGNRTRSQATAQSAQSAQQVIQDAQSLSANVESLELKDAVLDAAAAAQRRLGVYAATFETVYEQGKAAYHARRTQQSAQSAQEVDVKQLIKQFTGIDVDANAAQLGKELAQAEAQLTLPSTPTLFLPSSSN